MKERRYDIDWLRVIAMLAVFLFHCARFFDTEDWVLKNEDQMYTVDVLRAVLVWPWVMELFFLLSGFGAWYALKSRSGGQFLWDRGKRLLIPLYTVGLLLLNPPQYYFDVITNHGFRGTLWESLGFYFRQWEFHLTTPHGLVPVPSPMHLWFLQYLFLISLFTLPILLLFKSGTGWRWINRLAGWADRPGGIFLFFVPIVLILVIFPEAGGGTTHTWSDFIWYTVFFLTGYILAADSRFTESIKKHGWVCLGLWTILLAIGDYLPMLFGDDAIRESGWFFVVFMLFLGARYLSFSNKTLSYCNEAVLAFYLLHHTIIVCVGWFVIRWNMGILPKFLIVAVVSFTLMLIMYEYLVRRFDAVRFLFGMRLRKKSPAIPDRSI